MFTLNTFRTRSKLYVKPHMSMWGITALISLITINTHAAVCEYTIDNEWDSGFTAQISITNDGANDINGWNVCWEYDTDHQITSSWNTLITGTSPYCASPQAWNSTIQPGQRVEFGIQAQGSSSASIPELTSPICGELNPPPINTAPLAQFTHLSEQMAIFVDASGSSDADGDNLSYSWDFGDNTTANTATADHVYTQEGVYIILLTVSDGQASDTAQFSFSAKTTPPLFNIPPVASFTHAINALSVEFDASASVDDNGDTLTYSWDFGDGTTASNPQESHTYASDGDYTVTLTVDDGQDQSSTSETIIIDTSGEVTPSTCVIDYVITNEGDTNFQVNFTVTNNADRSFSGYDISWYLGNNESFVSGWNAEFSTSGSQITASNEAGHWNGDLAANGGRISFGFIINKRSGASPSIPTSFSGACSGGGAIPPVEPEPEFACGIDPSTAASDDDWLTTDGNQIVDSDGNSVWLTGANWFGMNATERVFHGLWSVNMEGLVSETARRGINLIRVPVSTELLKEWQAGVFNPVTVNLSTNPKLEGFNSLEIFDYFLDQAKSCGVKVLMDIHSAEADNSGHHAPLWYKGDITTEDWINTQVWLADRYKNNDTIIGYDLENEPHGSPSGSAESPKSPDESDFEYCNRLEETTSNDFAKWDDSTDINNWKYAAEQAAAGILNVHPNALILVEGIEAYATQGKWVNPAKIPNQPEPCYDFNWWGGNLKGVADMEVEVPGHQNQIMYSPHDYGPLVYLQSWFQTEFDRDSLRADVWEPNWLYIHNNNISPLLIGEWGGFMDGGDNQKWMEALRDEIADVKLHHTFWVINPNSGDTGGLIENDWITWDEDKYNLLKPALWQSNGKFVGLDKTIPIGGTANTGTTRP